jgi:lipoprotein-releasing system permease protein
MKRLMPAIRYLCLCHHESSTYKKTGWAITSIALSIATLIVVLSVMRGFEELFIKKLIGIDGQITIEGFLDQRNDIATLTQLDHLIGQDNVSPITQSQAVLTLGTQVILVTATGVIQQREQRFTHLKISAGNNKLDKNTMMIGSEIAKKYGIKVGDSLTLMSPLNGNTRQFKVSAIVESGLYHVDASLVMLEIQMARSLFSIPTPFTAFKVNPALPFKDRFALKAKLADTLIPNYRILTWDEKNRSLIDALHLERLMMMTVLSMMIILAGFNMSSTLTILTVQKRFDIGVLKTLGYSKNDITWIFLLKAISSAAIAAVLGVIVGIIIALNATQLISLLLPIVGLDITTEGALYFKQLPVSLHAGGIFAIVAFSMIVTILCALIPSRSAANIDAVQAISL